MIPKPAAEASPVSSPPSPRRPRWTLARKMILGYLPMALLITTTAAFGLSTLVRVNRTMAQAVEHDTPLIEGLDELVDTLLTQELYGQRFRILRSPEMVKEFRTYGGEFRRILRQMIATEPSEAESLTGLRVRHAEYEQLFAQSFETGGGIGLEEQLKGARGRVTDLANALSTRFQRRRDHRMREAAALGTAALHWTLALWGATLLVGVASLTLITRNITGSIRKLNVATDRIAEGEFERLPLVRTQDELGALSRAFSEMARKIKGLEEASLDANALTRLPGGEAIERVLRKRLATAAPLAFCLADLDNFKGFNDRYGYASGSEVIKALARDLEAALAAHGEPDDFLGHVGGDDFVLLTTPDRYRAICEAAIARFDAEVPAFYSAEDRARGYIVGLTRQGQKVHFPLVSVSIATVTNERHPFQSHIEVAEIAAELKEYAKSLPGSVLVVDRRRHEHEGLEHPSCLAEERKSA